MSLMERTRNGQFVYVVELAQETYAALQMLRAGRAGKRPPNPFEKGRNDPCHCGSGQKYKRCHGKGGR